MDITTRLLTLSRRKIHDYVVVISQITMDFLDQIKACAESDSDYQKLVQDVKEGMVRRYWLEDNLLHAK